MLLLTFWVFVVLTFVTICSTAYTYDEWVHGRMQGRWVIVNLTMLILATKIVYWVYHIVKQQDYLLR